jgi:hypothetical protein
MLSPQQAVQQQLEAYNAHDIDRFVAVYHTDVKIFRPPSTEPSMCGLEAVAEFHRTQRFTLPELHAELVNRIVLGNKVFDHERVTGLKDTPFEVVAVYEVIDGKIRTVWFYAPQ